MHHRNIETPPEAIISYINLRLDLFFHHVCGFRMSDIWCFMSMLLFQPPLPSLFKFFNEDNLEKV